MSELCINHIEEYWKIKIETANVLFEQKKYREALSEYKEALYRAEVLNVHQKDCIRDDVPFMYIYIVSCYNLCNTYEELDMKGEAEKILKRMICYLLYLKDGVHLRQDTIQRELKKATVTYINFVRRNDGDKKELHNLIAMIKKETAEV